MFILLDGYCSGDKTGKGDLNTPTYKELEAIFNHRLGYTILIDDARLFTGKEDYPTIEDLTSFIDLIKVPKSEIDINIIRITN